MAQHHGRSGRRWRRLVENVKLRRERCCRCQQPIDYSLRWPDAGSFSVDHFPFPLSTHPHLAEEPTNLHAAHLHCNQSAGASESMQPLVTTEEW